jgi:hypothetical protein
MWDAIEFEEARRQRSFSEFVETHNPEVLTYEHIPRLVDVAERVVSGKIRRLIVIEPPRYLKSEIFSRLLPAYYLRRHPDRRVAVVSYGAELAWELSEEARDFYRLDGGRLKLQTQAKKRWSTADGKGGMWAQGVGGALLGRGFHLGVVDDPTDPEKASSPTYQKRFVNWWPAKFLSRQDPRAAIILVMQRLGVGDPIEFLFRRELGEDTPAAPQYWHVVLCDEIKSEEPLGKWDGPMGLPSTCTLEADERKTGQILAPSLFDAAEVEERQREAGPYTAAAQRQGRPMRPAGDFWKEVWFRTYDELPKNAYDGGKDWDTAYSSEEENAASAYVESYRGPARNEKDEEWPIYIENVDWNWLEFPGLVDWMRQLAGPHYVEEKATGKSAVQTLKVYGINAGEVPVRGDKLMRAASAQPAVANHRIYVNRRIRDTLLYAEGQGLLRVTAEGLQASSGPLDLNDAFVQALHRHLGLGEKEKKGFTVQWA